MIETTLATKCLTADFEKIFARKGYAFFTKGTYNLNIIGVRHKGRRVTNQFDDYLVVIYNTPKERNVRKIFKCTTLPGMKAMKHPIAIKGTAILKEGQYRGAYKIGYHKGKYKALCQAKPLPVYRDGNKDDKFDLNPLSIDKGIFGINIHKAGDNSTLVDGWSYGCTVLAKSLDFNSLMRLVDRSASIYGNSFTYTLINEEDL
jgi:hypothetical protein